MYSIKQVLIRRDGMTPEEADDAIREAKELLQHYIAEGDTDAAENICVDEFGLEPDYLYELLG